MPEDANPDPAESDQGQDAEGAKRGFPLKTILVVVVAFALQIAVVLLVFQLAKPAAASGASDGDGASAQSPPATRYAVVDLGTYNITQFQSGDPVNRRQLAVTLGVSLDREEADACRSQVLDQKIWIGQLLDEIIGATPIDGLHATNREPLKQQLKAKINERLGEEMIQEVILRIQTFGP